MASSSARLILRNLPFHQSRNVVSIRHSGKDALQMASLLKEDWLHVMLRLPTAVTMFGLLTIWAASIFVFAAIYQAVDNAYEFTDCGLSSSFGKLSFGGFFAFSLQTCTTVGYGLPGSTQAFFESCPLIQVVIFCQMTYSMLFHAFAVALLFVRYARSESRGNQVIMSQTCCIRIEENRWILEVRVHDMDAMHPIVESHVRLYARTKTNELVLLRTLSPNDETGGMLFLGCPSLIRHEIDAYSPLHPTMLHKFRLPGTGLFLRDADSRTGSIEQLVCPICSESYGDMDRLRAHVQFFQITEGKTGYPVKGSHQSLKVTDFHVSNPPTHKEMKDSFPEEILVVVEGIEPLQSGTFQSLQSYKMEDVSWGGRFADCVVTGETTGSTVVVNLKAFHQVHMDEGALGIAHVDKQD